MFNLDEITLKMWSEGLRAAACFKCGCWIWFDPENGQLMQTTRHICLDHRVYTPLPGEVVCERCREQLAVARIKGTFGDAEASMAVCQFCRTNIDEIKQTLNDRARIAQPARRAPTRSVRRALWKTELGLD